MQKVIIDTNIYYSLIGISENTKVNKDSFLNFEKYITSATLIECIIKYKNDLATLKKIIQPLMENKYKLISIGYVPIENEQLNQIYLADNIDEINITINKILELKILKESEFARWFIYIIMPIAFDILSEKENYKFDDETKMKDFQKYIYSLFSGNIEYILDKFINKLQDGYANNDPQQSFSNEFYNTMYMLFFTYLSNYYQIKEFDNSLKPAELGNKVRECIEKDKFYKLVKRDNENNKNPFSFFAKKKYKEKFIKTLELLIIELTDNFYDKKLTEPAIKFIENKIYKIFTSESKLFKNDIFDLLITLSLEPNKYKLVSLDKKYIALIKEIDKGSIELIEQLGLKS
ncbi:hypothetical protein [Sulfurimonas sp.]|uniref:hypothetical protein n=1 Tax=Sulfurimonas sp. TaxID=2022749 RepID=UPI0035678EFF